MHHYSVKPLALSLRPSRLLMTVLVIAVLGTDVLLFLLPIPWPVALLLAMVMTAGFKQAIWRDALLQAGASIDAMALSAKGELRCHLRAQDWQLVQVLDSTYVAPWLSVLHLQVEGRRFARHVVLLPDSLDAEAYRQLRVWLKWGRALPGRSPGEKS